MSDAVVTEYTVYELARLAECASPDSEESAGARFLSSVQDAMNEQRAYSADGVVDDDTVTEVADGAPDVYTHRMWAEFVDLCAYQEDPTELGVDESDMEQAARVCLYMIATRLAVALNAVEVDA